MSSRLPFLDASRGLAALAVLLAHFQLTLLPQFSDSWISRSPLKLLFDGEAAVLYFFILSGYVLTLSVSASRITVRKYLQYTGRRVLRIYPAFLFTLLVTFLLVRLLKQPVNSWLSAYWQSVPGLESLLKQAMLIIRRPNEPELRLLPHDWTLSIEMFVSLLLPLLVLASSRFSLLVLILVYCAIHFANLDPFTWDFSLGIYLAQREKKHVVLLKKKSLKTGLLVFALLLLGSIYLFPALTRALDPWLLHTKSLALALLLAVLLSTATIQQALSCRPLTFLGRISYSFYLMHLSILYFLFALMPTLNPSLFLLVYLIVTIIISTMTYNKIERPFMRLGRILFTEKQEKID